VIGVEPWSQIEPNPFEKHEYVGLSSETRNAAGGGPVIYRRWWLRFGPCVYHLSRDY
jgi:hypothetical protein